MRIGDSIAVSGVCLTAVELSEEGCWADVSVETLSRTTLARLREGSQVNLEKALMPTTRMGGHLVSGHVDGVGKVMERRDEGRSTRLLIKSPDALAKYIAEKGSICVDGVSLTVNSVRGAEFGLNIVPHTMEQTTLSDYRVGTDVNLEVDVIARYLERLLVGEQPANNQTSPITRGFLAEFGFIKGGR